MKLALAYSLYAAVLYTIGASIYNRFYISGSVANPLPNPIGNMFGLR